MISTAHLRERNLWRSKRNNHRTPPRLLSMWRATFLTSIASEFRGEVCNCRTPLFFIYRSLIIERRKRGSYRSIFCRKICKAGLQKFWIRYNIGCHTRYLPNDFMYEKLGANFCSNLLNAHILAEYGMKTKVVSKKCKKV